MSTASAPRLGVALTYECDYCGHGPEVLYDIPAGAESDTVVQHHLLHVLGWEAMEEGLRCPACRQSGRSEHGAYLRQDSDYVRPERFYNIGTEYKGETMTVTPWVRDASPLLAAGIADGVTCGFELVPEGGNPWDSSAVSLDFKGIRIGYFHRNLARHLHPHLTTLLSAGVGLLAHGVVHVDEPDEDEDLIDCVRIHMEVPYWDDLRKPTDATFGVGSSITYEEPPFATWLHMEGMPALTVEMVRVVENSRSTLEALDDGSRIEIMLLPELNGRNGTPDVGIGYEGRKLGCLSKGFAEFWYDYALVNIQEGFGLHAFATVHNGGPEDPVTVKITLPHWGYALFELDAGTSPVLQCRALLSALSDADVGAAVSAAWGAIPANVLTELMQASHLAPNLTWPGAGRTGQEIPGILRAYLRNFPGTSELERIERKRSEGNS